jgi:peptidoglycan/LPS O-acetylase OafA/YrhL
MASVDRLAVAVYLNEIPASDRVPGPKVNLRGRIRELDGVRGLAIALVLIFHYLSYAIDPGPGLLPRLLRAAIGLTWSGVDLFFVLSGFLIGGILVEARESSDYFRVFYTRRFFRIVPIYAAFLLAFWVITVAARRFPTMDLGKVMTEPMPWYSYVTFTQNFWSAARQNMGAYGLAITWSLAVEEQFYLTLPLIVRLLPPARLLKFVLVGIALVPALRSILYFAWQHNSVAIYVLMPCRADALLLGVLGAVLTRDPDWRAKIATARLPFRIAFPVLVLGLLVFTKLGSVFSSAFMAVLGLTWIAVFYFCVLLFVLTHTDGWLAKVFRNSALCWLGTIAYGVYLFHQTVLAVVFRLFGVNYLEIEPGFHNWPPLLLALVITLVTARLSWQYFERPLIDLGHRARYHFADHGQETTTFSN